MTESRTIVNECPGCTNKLTTIIPTGILKEGELTVCGDCACMIEFTAEEKPILLTTEKFDALPEDQQQEMNETVYLIVNMHK